MASPSSLTSTGWAIVDKLTRNLGTVLGEDFGPGQSEGVLNDLIAQMTRDLVEAKNLVLQARDQERYVVRQVEAAETSAREWAQRAMSAVRARDDFSARDALVRKAQCDRAAALLREDGRRQHDDVDRLMVALVGLHDRVEEAKRKRGSILLRARRAKLVESVRVSVLSQPNADPHAVLDAVDRQIALEAAAGENPELAEDAPLTYQTTAAHAEADLLRLKKARGRGASPKKPLAKTGSRPELSAGRLRTKR